ncbi:MAG: three-Cys-motif partner protein TcmP [Bauldia sp.]|nr:three-Cys-motif partner protein TcmP [Bauldia sp.]
MRQHYIGGREHAAIKHAVLKAYLEPLAFKTLQARSISSPSFAYIDGYTGPWGAVDDATYIDTSFGVALGVLRSVKQRLPNARIKCVFCEVRRTAFRTLEKFVSSNAEGLDVLCVNGRFEENIDQIVNFIGPDGFRFAFIDPTGWKVDAAAITPLLRGKWSEVLFNFMADFINRFPDFDQVSRAYAALLGNVDWRRRYDETPASLPNDERILILFRKVLKERWSFSHLVELPIRKPSRDKIFYTLVYGTRSPHGVLAFRDAQAKAEKEGYAVAAEATRTAQFNLFSADEQADQIAAFVGVSSRENCAVARERILLEVRAAISIEFLKLAAVVMEDVPVRERDIAQLLQELAGSRVISYAPIGARGAPTRASVVSLA